VGSIENKVCNPCADVPERTFANKFYNMEFLIKKHPKTMGGREYVEGKV
jgi:hypothetical protein